MEVHGQALERMIEMIFESREGGSGLIDRLGKDEAAGGLLLLYSLHPDALETRVQAAMERMRARLRKLSCSIELLRSGRGRGQGPCDDERAHVRVFDERSAGDC